MNIVVSEQEVFINYGTMLGLTVHKEVVDGETWVGYSTQPQECRARPWGRSGISSHGYDYIEFVAAFDDNGDLIRAHMHSHVAFYQQHDKKLVAMMDWLKDQVNGYEEFLREAEGRNYE